MSGEIDIYEMAMRQETRLRDARIERMRQRNEADVPSTSQPSSRAPLVAVLAWTSGQLRSLLHHETVTPGSAQHVTPAPMSPGDPVSPRRSHVG